MDIVFLKSFFGYGFLINYIVLFIWFMMFFFAKNFMFSLHSRLFQISESDLNRMHYGGMAFLKLLALVFFLAPYLAIHFASN